MPREAATIIAVFLLLGSVAANASQQIWQNLSSEQARSRGVNHGTNYFSVDEVGLRNLLSGVPHRSTGDFSREIELPMPDGSLARFQIVESPIMADGLAQRYPQVKTFKVCGIDDEHASGRVDITSRGFSGMLQTAQGRVFIDPDYGSQQADLYRSQYRNSGQSGQPFTCGVHRVDHSPEYSRTVESKTAQRLPGKILQYNLAVSATEEYVTAVYNASNSSSAVDQAQATIVTAINRVNQIYERDLGIRLVLVDDNDELIENGSNVRFSNFDPGKMFKENADWIDAEIGGGTKGNRHHQDRRGVIREHRSQYRRREIEE